MYSLIHFNVCNISTVVKTDVQHVIQIIQKCFAVQTYSKASFKIQFYIPYKLNHTGKQIQAQRDDNGYVVLLHQNDRSE